MQGRAFTNEDGGPGRQIAIVNQRLVDQHFKGQNPIGRVIRLSLDIAGGEPPQWATVVGIVPNVRQLNNNQERDPDAIAYIPHRQNTSMARSAQVIWLFLRRSLLQLTIGLTIGLGAALAAGQVLQSMLVQTSARDPVTLAAIVVLLIAVSLAACLGPARRATRLDPLEALRHV